MFILAPIYFTKNQSLKWSKLEADSISYFVKGLVIKSIDSNATETNFKRIILESHFDWLHISTHLMINPDDSLNNYFVLKADQKNDGYLFFDEFHKLNTKMDLLTLSVCGEGISNTYFNSKYNFIERSLNNNRFSSIVFSLWDMNNKISTSFFMEYYKRLDNDKYESLRNAKLEFIKSPDYCNPYHWAPFVLYGRR